MHNRTKPSSPQHLGTTQQFRPYESLPNSRGPSFPLRSHTRRGSQAARQRPSQSMGTRFCTGVTRYSSSQSCLLATEHGSRRM